MEMVTDAAWKIASIVRSARFFTDGELVNLYKSQLLSYFEYRTAAIYHACDTVLAPLNQFQNRFLRELGISVEDALFHFNLAPLQSRRDIAMLARLWEKALSIAERQSTRAGSKQHSRQLHDIRKGH